MQRNRARLYLVSGVLGALSFLAPHYGVLLVANMQTLFHRETTLWMTLSLLLISSALLRRTSAHPLALLVATMAGATMAVLLYIFTTVDLRASQLFGAVSPLFLWTVSVGVSVVLMTPAVVAGLLLGGGVRRLRSAAPGTPPQDSSV